MEVFDDAHDEVLASLYEAQSELSICIDLLILLKNRHCVTELNKALMIIQNVETILEKQS